jgi:hypothetical protein
MSEKNDRRVHIRTRDGREVVHYDRAGKWYIEYPDGRRFPIRLGDAVAWSQKRGAEVFTGLPGGIQFDKAIASRRTPTRTTWLES